MWCSLLLSAVAILRHMTSFHHDRCPSGDVAVMFQGGTWQQAEVLVDAVTSDKPGIKFFYFNMDEKSLEKSLQNVLLVKARLDLVLLLTDNETLHVKIFQYVMKTPDFYWTALVHMTEWFILTTNRNATVNLKQSLENMPDFVTVVSPSSDQHISVHQKCRTQTLQEVLILDRYPEVNMSQYVNADGRVKPQNYNDVLPSKFEYRYFTNTNKCCEQNWNRAFDEGIRYKSFGRVRSYGKLYLKQGRSILEGVHLKVSLFVYPAGQDSLVMEQKVGNRTELAGYYVSMLKIFAESLGFTYVIVNVTDTGYYGNVDQTGNYRGVVGQLARRQTAFSLIPLTMVEWRLKVIDFIFVTLTSEYKKVMYKLPEPDSALDTTYFDIVQSDLVLTFLLAPLVIIALIGAYLHVITRSCTSAYPEPCSMSAMRRLHSYPDHFCFETQRYASQSGRVLKATWGVFWLILSSAYCAYLTTSFAVKSRELRIDSLEKLAHVQGYDIGINGMMKLLISNLNDDAADPAYGALGRIVHRLNQTNPMTFSDNVTYHRKRVRQGKYVFVTFGPIPGITEEEFPDPEPLLRTYVLQKSSELVSLGVVKDAFFKEELYEYTLRFMASGLSGKLKQDILKTVVKDTLVSEEVPVNIKRIEIILYTVLACLAVSAGCLVVEYGVERAVKGRRSNCSKLL